LTLTIREYNMTLAHAGLLLCALAIGLALGTLIGAVLLRAAVALYNKMAGGASSPGSVPQPAFGKAMWISFDIWVAQLIVGLFIGALTGPRATVPRADEKGVNVDGLLIPVLIGLFIQVAILSAKLPTTFGRAILVTLCDLLIATLAAGVLAAIAVIVFALALA
jgi:hypothetical protein